MYSQLSSISFFYIALSWVVPEFRWSFLKDLGNADFEENDMIIVIAARWWDERQKKDHVSLYPPGTVFNKTLYLSIERSKKYLMSRIIFNNQIQN
jgi:hypothetical protein